MRVGDIYALDLFGNDQLIELDLVRLLLGPHYMINTDCFQRQVIDVHELAGHDEILGRVHGQVGKWEFQFGRFTRDDRILQIRIRARWQRNQSNRKRSL
jgi:hypothetical protein